MYSEWLCHKMRSCIEGDVLRWEWKNVTMFPGGCRPTRQAISSVTCANQFQTFQGKPSRYAYACCGPSASYVARLTPLKPYLGLLPFIEGIIATLQRML